MATNKFTKQAQEALQSAQQIMQTYQHNQLDVEHIFLALLQQPDSLPVAMLTKAGGDVPNMVRRLENALRNYSSSDSFTTGYLTTGGNRVLQSAAEEAARLNDELVSTEHLLLSVAREREGVPPRILQEAGIDLQKLHVVLREIRSTRGVTAESPRTGPKKYIVNPPSLAKPTGFNHGILTTGGRLLFLAGQTALNAEGQIVAPDDMVGQYRQALSNLKTVVEAAGGTMQDIVQMKIFVYDCEDYQTHLQELGQVHKEFFGAYYPATSLLEISRFFDEEALVEIEGIAVIE